jgi:hypothetical protein
MLKFWMLVITASMGRFETCGRPLSMIIWIPVMAVSLKPVVNAFASKAKRS